MFRLDHTGNTEEWLDNLGRQVFWPRQGAGSERQGGLSVSAPVYDIVPDSEAWTGVKLPRHGLLHNLSRLHPIDHQREIIRVRDVLGDEYHIPFSEPNFPWVMSVSTRVVRKEGVHELIYQTTIMRSFNCRNHRRMPCSIGLRPCFATHGNQFKVFYHNKLAWSSADDLSSPQVLDIDECLITLETDVATISIKPYVGFDRVFVWTDNPAEYVCIEPTIGLRHEYSLECGQLLSGTCVINYQAKGV